MAAQAIGICRIYAIKPGAAAQPFAGKPAPTMIASVICRSWLASDGGLTYRLLNDWVAAVRRLVGRSIGKPVHPKVPHAQPPYSACGKVPT